MKNINTENIILWDIPDGFASYIIKKLPDKTVFHVGRYFVLSKAKISLRIDAARVNALKAIIRNPSLHSQHHLSKVL